jgi:hypothetical protein
MATIQTAADWPKQWFEIADATYLNTAAHAAMPRVALHAVQTSMKPTSLRITRTTSFSSKLQAEFGHPSRK